MRIPSIHMNGTSQKDLLKDVSRAMSALRDAMDALGKMGPNGRDYYPQGDTAIREAQREHQDRYKKLDEVYKELEQLGEAISDGGHKMSTSQIVASLLE